MKIFHIKEDLSRNRVGYVDAVHKWGLPGVSCPVCKQIWAGTGLEYPTIDLSSLRERKLFEKPRVEPLHEVEEMKKILKRAFPNIGKIGPGTLLGQMVGKSTGHLNDFVWHNPWTLLITIDALTKLQSYELSLPVTVAPALKFNTKQQEIYEFEICPRGILLNGIYKIGEIKICPGCDRDSATMPERLIVDGSSLPKNLDMFRLSNFATVILVTEPFVEAVKDLNIRGAVFQEIEVK